MSDTLVELARLLEKGGFVMPPLVAGALLLWFALGYRGVLLYRFDAAKASHLGEDALRETEMGLDRFSSLVKSIVRAAPLAGLLGTVSGMIDTFDALGDTTLLSQAGGVAGGISEALFSTQMGLLVAIPGLLIGRILDRRQERLQAEVAQLSNIEGVKA